MGQGESSAKADFQFSGFLPLKIILTMSFIILMQSGFLYRGHCVEIWTGDFYSYNEIIRIGNILMVSLYNVLDLCGQTWGGGIWKRIIESVGLI